MKKILLSTVALVSLSAGALAADLPSRRAPAPFVAAVPVFTWTGLYFGVNAGYGWSDSSSNDTLTFAPGTFTGLAGGGGPLGGTITFGDNGDADGFLGGAQIGYNWQFTPGTGFVVGLEADIQAIDLDRNRGDGLTFASTGGGVPAGFQPLRNDVSTIDWFGTVRGRLGYAFDRTLVYATGGFAYAGGDNHSDCDRFFTTACSRGGDDTRWGYAVGGGVEFALPMAASLFGSSAMTFKIEGLYVNLDESDNHNGRADLVGFTAGGTPVFNGGGAGNGVAVRGGREETDFALVRAGINFKF